MGGVMVDEVEERGLEPRPCWPSVARLARLLAQAEAAGLLPEARWLVEQSLLLMRQRRVLGELARACLGTTWEELARLLEQFDQLLAARREWGDLGTVLEPPLPSLEALRIVYAVLLESSYPEERRALDRVGRRLEALAAGAKTPVVGARA